MICLFHVPPWLYAIRWPLCHTSAQSACGCVKHIQNPQINFNNSAFSFCRHFGECLITLCSIGNQLLFLSNSNRRIVPRPSDAIYPFLFDPMMLQTLYMPWSFVQFAWSAYFSVRGFHFSQFKIIYKEQFAVQALSSLTEVQNSNMVHNHIKAVNSRLQKDEHHTSLFWSRNFLVSSAADKGWIG